MSEWSWIKNSWSDCSIWLNEKRVAVLSIYDEATEENQDELEAEMDEHAVRITACMNALEGLSDIALLGGWSYKGMNAHALKIEQENAALQARVAELEAEKWNAQIAEAEKERDELAKELKYSEMAATAEARAHDEARMQVDELIKERDGLAAKCAELDDKRKSLCVELEELRGRHQRECSKLQRKACTDEYVRRIKADAVREFADQTGDHYVINMAINYNKASQIEREDGRE